MKVLTIRDLAGLPGAFAFHVHDDHVSIPGYGGGRDGPTTPNHPEQEAWMRAHSGLKEIWHLCWALPDLTTRARFLALLGVHEGV